MQIRAASTRLQRARAQPGWNAAAVARQGLQRPLYGTPWEEMLPAHVAALAAIADGRAGDAYQQLIASVQPFIKVSPPLALSAACRRRFFGHSPRPLADATACSSSSDMPQCGAQHWRRFKCMQ